MTTKCLKLMSIQPTSTLMLLLLILILVLLPTPTLSSCVANTANCQICSNSYTCNICQLGYHTVYDRRNSNYICRNCTDIYCLDCLTNNTNVCTYCKIFNGVDAGTNTCRQCNDNNCVDCGADYLVCTSCQTYYQLTAAHVCVSCPHTNCYQCLNGTCLRCDLGWGVSSPTTCTACSTINCQYCPRNYQICQLCISQYGFTVNQTCLPCLSTNCDDCRYDYTVCLQCASGYGVGVNVTAGCQPCSIATPYCALFDTSSSYQCQCLQCNSGYGIDYNNGRPNRCRSCSSNCTTCSTRNYLACLSCAPVVQHLFNYTCYICTPNCNSCNNAGCQTCANGYYMTTLGTCQLCPDECLTCVWNGTYTKVQCTTCIGGAALITTVTPARCPDLICGDSLTISRPCDNALGIPYDGCDDTCQVMPDFNCTVDTNTQSTLCSFNGTLIMQVISFKRVKFENTLIIKVSVFPPLQVFKQSTQAQNNALFSVSMDNTEVKSLAFDAATSELTIQLEMTGQITTTTPIIVTFTPSTSIRPEYFASITQSLTLNIDYGNEKIYFISNAQTAITNTFLYPGYAIVALAWISCILGLFLRHLASLEAMLVVQFSWLMVLWLNVPLNLPLLKVWPLKYSHGFALSFDGNNTTDPTESAPFTSQFRISASHFHSNFNLLLLLFIISLIAVIVTYIRMQNFVKQEKLRSIDDIRKKAADPEIKQQGQKLEGRYELAEQSLMTATMLSIVPFVSSAALFIKVGDLSNAASLAILAIGGIVIIIVLIRFYWNPHPCGYFRYSFRGQPLALLHCFVHIIVLIITITLLIALPSLSFAPIAPIALQLVFTIIYRPYLMMTDNVRSVFNLFVMCAFVGFRIFAQYCSEQTLNSNLGYAFILGLYGALFLVIIIGLVFTTYYYYWFNYKLSQIPQQKEAIKNGYRDVIDQQMGQIDPNEPLRNVKAGLSFVPLIEPDNTMRNFTQQLQSASSRREKQEEERMREQTRNYHSVAPQKLQVTQESSGCRSKKQFVEAMLKLDRLKATDRPDKTIDSFPTFKRNTTLDQPQSLSRTLNTVLLKSVEEREQFVQIALTALKQEKKFIDCQAAMMIVRREMQETPSSNASQYNNQYNDIKIKFDNL